MQLDKIIKGQHPELVQSIAKIIQTLTLDPENELGKGYNYAFVDLFTRYINPLLRERKTSIELIQNPDEHLYQFSVQLLDRINLDIPNSNNVCLLVGGPEVVLHQTCREYLPKEEGVTQEQMANHIRALSPNKKLLFLLKNKLLLREYTCTVYDLEKEVRGA